MGKRFLVGSHWREEALSHVHRTPDVLLKSRLICFIPGAGPPPPPPPPQADVLLWVVHTSASPLDPLGAGGAMWELQGVNRCQTASGGMWGRLSNELISAESGSNQDATHTPAPGNNAPTRHHDHFKEEEKTCLRRRHFKLQLWTGSWSHCGSLEAAGFSRLLQRVHDHESVAARCGSAHLSVLGEDPSHVDLWGSPCPYGFSFLFMRGKEQRTSHLVQPFETNCDLWTVCFHINANSTPPPPPHTHTHRCTECYRAGGSGPRSRAPVRTETAPSQRGQVVTKSQ